MPFDFKAFDTRCTNMTIDELQREWEHYTRLISGSATSTAVSGAAIPFTLGVSVIGVGLAAPAIHNARKKREIIERHLNRHGTTHHTRKRDVLTPMAISGTVGVVTLGVGGAGAGFITNAAAEHGLSAIAANEIAVKATTHLAVDGVAMMGEEYHMNQKKEAEAWRASQAQPAIAGVTPTLTAPVPSPGNMYSPQSYGQPVPTTPGYYPPLPTDVKLPHLAIPPTPASISRPTTPSTPAPPYSALEGVPLQPVVASNKKDMSYFSIPPPPPLPTSVVTENQNLQIQPIYFPPPPSRSPASQSIPSIANQSPSFAIPSPSFSWKGDVKKPLQTFSPMLPPENSQALHNASQHHPQSHLLTAAQPTTTIVYPSYPGTTTQVAHSQEPNGMSATFQNLQLQPAVLYEQTNATYDLPNTTVAVSTNAPLAASPTISGSINFASPVSPPPVAPFAAMVQGYPSPAQTPGTEKWQVQQPYMSPSFSTCLPQVPYGGQPLPTPAWTPQTETNNYFPPPPTSPRPLYP